VTLAISRGLRVVATDPADGAEARLRGTVAAQLAELGQPAAPNRLIFTADLGEAAAAADLVLENGPERLETKREIFAALDAALEEPVQAIEQAGDDVEVVEVIATTTDLSDADELHLPSEEES
jgi:carnitine 3-dehydrogenase